MINIPVADVRRRTSTFECQRGILRGARSRVFFRGSIFCLFFRGERAKLPFWCDARSKLAGHKGKEGISERAVLKVVVGGGGERGWAGRTLGTLLKSFISLLPGREEGESKQARGCTGVRLCLSGRGKRCRRRDEFLTRPVPFIPGSVTIEFGIRSLATPARS